jgi:hypothetical protein
MENDGITIHRNQELLTVLNRKSNLNDPKAIRSFILKLKIADSSKKSYAVAYGHYTKYYGIQWEKPRFKPRSRPVKISTKGKIEMLIANAKVPLSTKLGISSETGLRPTEIFSLRARDVDLEKDSSTP